MRGQSGFTLIELMIVVAILGVLAGVVLLSVGSIDERAREGGCKVEHKTIETALEAYKLDFGGYPSSLAALVTSAPHYLKMTSFQARWSFTAGSDEYSGVAQCAGY